MYPTYVLRYILRYFIFSRIYKTYLQTYVGYIYICIKICRWIFILHQIYLGISAPLLKYVNIFKRVLTYLARYPDHMFPILQISQHCFPTAHISWIISLHFARNLRSILHISFTWITPPPAPPLPCPAQWARLRFLNLNATAVQLRARSYQTTFISNNAILWQARRLPPLERKAYAAKRRSQNSIR